MIGKRKLMITSIKTTTTMAMTTMTVMTMLMLCLLLLTGGITGRFDAVEFDDDDDDIDHRFRTRDIQAGVGQGTSRPSINDPVCRAGNSVGLRI